MGRINDVIIVANRNYVHVDFIVLDIDCNSTCPIILGRPFLRTIGAIIDMKERNIRFQFPLRKGMEHFHRKKIKLPYESHLWIAYQRWQYLDLFVFLCLAALNDSACWEATQSYFRSLLFVPI